PPAPRHGSCAQPRSLHRPSRRARAVPVVHERAGHAHRRPGAAPVARTGRLGSVTVSVFDLFKIGIGPSSSHTVGPMRAAARFSRSLEAEGLAVRTTRVKGELFGSLGATGHGHGSVGAVVWGLEGEDPETVDTDLGPLRTAEVAESGRLRLSGDHWITFDIDRDLVLHRRRTLPFHPNGMTFPAWAGDEVVAERTSYSIGGGFVLDDDGSGHPELRPDPTPVPYPFSTGTELLEI